MSLPTERSDYCPFIDDDQAPCRSHFTLNTLSEAFGDCVDNYRRCPHYCRLLIEHPQRLVVVTAHGRTLQPTGT